MEPGYKRCSKCKVEKPVEEFSRDRQKKDGLRSSCRECQRASQQSPQHRARQRAHYAANRERYREKARRYREHNREKARATSLAYMTPERQRAYYWENIEKKKAHRAVRRAIRDGRLVRQPCRVCGAERTDAHHWSYEEEHWLDVYWLCRQHHALIDRGEVVIVRPTVTPFGRFRVPS